MGKRNNIQFVYEYSKNLYEEIVKVANEFNLHVDQSTGKKEIGEYPFTLQGKVNNLESKFVRLYVVDEKYLDKHHFDLYLCLSNQNWDKELTLTPSVFWTKNEVLEPFIKKFKIRNINKNANIELKKWNWEAIKSDKFPNLSTSEDTKLKFKESHKSAIECLMEVIRNDYVKPLIEVTNFFEEKFNI
jgi:hypothetical protein